MNFKVYFINLDDKESVWLKAKNLFSLLPEEMRDCLERVSAVDTRHSISPVNDFGLKVDPIGLVNKLYFSQSNGAVGCYLSHYKIWKKMISEKVDYSIILEDDVVISDVVNYLMTNPVIDKDIDLTNLNGRNSEGHDLLKLDGSEAYMLSNQGAEKLIALTHDHSPMQGAFEFKPWDWEPKIGKQKPWGGENPNKFKCFKDEPPQNFLIADSIICPLDKFLGACCHKNVHESNRLSYKYFPIIDLCNIPTENSSISSGFPYFLMKEEGLNGIINSNQFEYWNNPLKITICTCTYNNYYSLYKSVSASFSQDIGSSNYSLLILDNTPKDTINSLAENDPFSFEMLQKTLSLFDKHSNCKYVHKEVNGVSGARNACIEYCETPLIYFVDDDIILEKNACANAVKKFQDYPSLGVLGGKVSPDWGDNKKPSWLSDENLGLLSILDFGSKDIIINESSEKNIWLVGANLCFRKSIFEKCGKFSEHLGRKGKTRSLLGSEDCDMIKRVMMHYNALYTADCSCSHYIHPERLSQKWFIRRVFWQQVSDILSNNAPEILDKDNLTVYLKENIDLLLEEQESEASFSKKLIFLRGLASLLL